MFAQESVMDIKKEREAFESVFTETRGWDLTFIMGCYQNIETLRAFAGWQAAKSQAVPEVINVGNELQSWVAVWSFKARHDRKDYIVVDANLLADKIEKLTGANA